MTDTEKARPRLAVVSFAVDADDREKRRALLDGMRECAVRLVEMGCPVEVVAREAEQIANDVEAAAPGPWGALEVPSSYYQRPPRTPSLHTKRD